MTYRAYAKINIGLRILGKRPDGYHDIETVFHQINLYDELQFTPSETIRLTTSSPHVPSDSTNLCVRAAEALRKIASIRDGVDIQLTKRIPVGAGLGGGSSDAATVLTSLNKQWKTGLQVDQLLSLAAELGSDVPFFLRGGTAVGTSRGEILDHFDLTLPYWILTVTPDLHVSTAWAYSNVRTSASTERPLLRSIIDRAIDDPAELKATVRNDFEDTVFRQHPAIAKIKDTLIREGAVFSQLSGSGSSVYGFFTGERSAREAAERFPHPFVTSLTAPDFRPIQNL